MLWRTSFVLVAILGGCSAQPAWSQQHGDAHLEYAAQTWDATYFLPEGRYDPAVPTPEEIVGFPLGRRPLRYSKMRLIFERLAAHSGRIRLVPMSQTHEGRQTFYAAIGRPERLANLDGIRAQMATFADPRLGGADPVPADLPLVAWFGYSIHGDELSGCDAATQMAYQLVAGQDESSQSIRDSLLVLLDPLQNPDGRERYLSQIQSLTGRVANADDQSLQHRGYWPWGRTNHYLFDLNRDWFTLAHPESRGRVTAISSWNPQLVIDGHEMNWDDTFLFSPPREPFNPHLPSRARYWWEQFAADQADAFDQQGWSFYTREWNEEFFPGYGSSWASYLGAIGILYEQARTAGSVVRQTDGSYLTFREAVAHQFVSTWSNLQTAAQHRRGILRDFRDDRKAAIREGTKGAIRCFAFPDADNASRLQHLVGTLMQQGIEVHQAQEPLELSDAHDFWGGSYRQRRLPAGSYVVDLAQPAHRLARNLLDFHVAMPDSFLLEERDYLENQKGSRLYEVTSWSMPLAYDVETYWSRRLPQGELRRLESLTAAVGQAPEPARFAYALDAADDLFSPALAALLQENLQINVALDAFSVQGRDFVRGTAILRVQTNPEDLGDIVRRVAQRTGARFDALQSGRASRGPDLGGSRFPALRTPRIALLSGSPVSFTSYGAIWHLLDYELQLRVSSLSLQDVEDLDLDKYNVLVMPDVFGGAASYARALGKRGEENLLEWIESGGTLICIGAASAFAADSARAWSAVRLRREQLEDHASAAAYWPVPESRRMQALGDPSTPAAEALLPFFGKASRSFVRAARPRGVVALLEGDYENRKFQLPEQKIDLEARRKADARLRRFHPQGAFVTVEVDQEHWLTGGLPPRLPGLITHDRAFLAASPVRVLGRIAGLEDIHLSGLLWPEAADRLARTAYLTRESRGQGQIILFCDDPSYRRATRGQERLLLNAVLLGPGLGSAREAPW